MASTVDPGDRLRLVATGDFDDLAVRATPFLVAREAENCLALGILGDPPGPLREAYIALLEAAGEVAGAAIMAPSAGLVLTAGTPVSGIPLLVDDLVRSGRRVSSVLGPPDLVAAFARAWTEATAAVARPGIAQRAYELRAVRATREAPGSIRAAGPRDRPLLVAWFEAFALEALGEAGRPGAEAVADRLLSGAPGIRSVHLWEADGRPVSMAAINGPTPHGIRVSGVYTPPALRERGFASACVAALSQAQLDAGRQACFLFADRANPAAHRIYRAIGYEPVGDLDRFTFGAATGGRPGPLGGPPKA